jgi:lysozyme family protein
VVAKVIMFDALRKEYESLFETCKVHADKAPLIDEIVLRMAANRARYEGIAKQVHCPWWLVGIIHYIECGLRFDRHLHNGDRLTAKTIRVPQGRPAVGQPPFTFEQSALDALRLKRVNEVGDWSVARVLFLLEGYNGYGYRQYHPGVLSPYLWSFTNHYTKGKYTKDGHFDPECVSQQAGLGAILKCAVQLGVIKLEEKHA